MHPRTTCGYSGNTTTVKMVPRDQRRGTKLAKDEHLKILQQGVVAWNQWREEHSGITPDLTSTKLWGANLARANLSDANLSGAYLRDVNLENADLSRAVLVEADLGE